MSSRGPASVMDTAPTDLGLVVQVGNGYERMVMADQEICDDVLATIPKLKAASAKDTFGRRWKQRKRKNGVDMFELSPGGGDDPDDDLDIAHALVAKTEIRCHLNEVLNVLVNPESNDYEASMQALCGRKFKRGHVLFKQRRKFHFRTAGDKEDVATVAQDGLVGVQLATLRPKLRVKMSTKHKRTQRLVFASCTQQYPSKDRAIHVVKTIPKDAHDQVVSSQDRAALRRELDHIAVGYDIQSKHNGYGSINHTTRIFLHAYASTVPPQQYGRVSRKHGIVSAADLARRREAIMNPEATQVLDILAKSLRQFETVIRRRRFGFQTFIYFPTHYNDSSAHASCSICSKSFSLFRRDFFCQLCGNMVCNDCSQNYEVEPRIGEVRKNRCCIQCVVRVDSCVFDDEEMLPALGPVVVEADESAWWEEHPVLEDTGEEDDDDETVSVRSDTSGISDQLFSQDAAARSHALEMLAQLVRSSGSTQPPKTIRTTSGGRTSAKNAKPPVTTKQILRDVESHLSQSLRVNRDQYAEPDNCAVYEGERDYVYKYDPTATLVTSVDTPLGPVFQPDVEAKRLAYIEQSKVTEPQYDTAALDLLAQVAAQKLNCPIGFVSVIDHDSFRAVGRYNYPDDGVVLPRDESLCIHNVYAEKPMIIKNPQRDMRFAQMGCIKHMGVKFYAGFPIRAPDGSVVASLCTGDLVTHDNITTKDYATMQALTKLAADLLLPQMPKQPSQVRGVARDVSMHHQQQQQQQYGSGRGSQRGGHRADPYAVY